MPFGLTVLTSATDPAIPTKTLGLGMTTLIISNEEMQHIKIAKSLGKPSLLKKY